MAEDLEWALLVRQRLVFLEDADHGTTEGTKKTKKQKDSVELPNRVSSYYLCPSYVVPDSECIFDYSRFTALAADEPIGHRLGPDGKLLHYQSRIQLSTETGEASFYSVKVTEAGFQGHLRNHQYCQEDIIRKGRCQGHPGDFSKGVSLPSVLRILHVSRYISKK